ncbi:MAG: hypothetical protein WBG50_08715 [Desulfomonilaceae bacterium]
MDEKTTCPKDVEKAGRLSAITQLIKAASLLIWSIVAFIIIAGLGYHLFLSGKWAGSLTGQRNPTKKESRPVPPVYTKLDKAVEEALNNARIDARQYALSQLDKWEKGLKERVDNDFLDWYFSYWNTQIRGAKALYYGAIHWVDSNQPTAAEESTEEFQSQFASRVLQPQTSQMQLERIQAATLERYLHNLRSLVAQIPKRYNVTPAVWQNYIADISQQSSIIEGGRNVPITLKALYASTAAGTVVLAGKVIGAFEGKALAGIGSNLGEKIAAKTMGKLAAKTGGKVAAKVGGKFLGPIVGVGVIIWDVWDHASTVEENKPILRQSIYSYLDEMKLSLLDDPETGVMSGVDQMERQFRKSLKAASKQRTAQLATPSHP